MSAFVRCKNEEEYIVPSLMSAQRVFDEILVIMNKSSDRTRELVLELASHVSKIRLLDYEHECASTGPGYLESVRRDPTRSLATYYNWCVEQTAFSHVCKWDGDMIALPPMERARDLVLRHDVVVFDGYDVLGKYTTDMEPRIFRYSPERARYADWDLYEILEHKFENVARVDEKWYLHMKLVKQAWLHKEWVCPNEFAARPVPEQGLTRPLPSAARLKKIISAPLRAFGFDPTRPRTRKPGSTR